MTGYPMISIREILQIAQSALGAHAVWLVRSSQGLPPRVVAWTGAVQDAGADSSSGSGLMLMIDGARAAGRKR